MKYFIGFLLAVVVILLLIPVVDNLLSWQECRTFVKQSFIIDKEFSKVRNRIIDGKFEEEVAKVNELTYISKKWTNLDFDLVKPFRKPNWAFYGELNARIAGKNNEIYNISQKLKIGKDHIDINCYLVKNLVLGQVAIKQNIEMKPLNDKTIVNIWVSMELQHLLSPFRKDKMKKELEKESNKIIDGYHQAILNLPEGITFHLK